ncbi:MAG: flagellar biosynthesis anti-sigma factor FlgM [Curvibacter sp. RIFCSPHIGHO2_12_FULL_63_18]|uniref:flagellar biosynthesis anti-sigma factor FlgM n=1 Tax=Rhodoferax sp. TaxID=50421 RepID=UPI0008ABF1ED|nr:flagellar biosynthesis anti-sigma factor FlgM [Rhodoferax sp.]OGO98881.1 MAG: flagellar biosynthesis anti-sigma factor FlgM [Curvibacter sp. GWA2_63_95]OGP06243.1 MAG: flagellar biosynthesis anti-sigma factor FlgM [Curvibacter sp. RIFCSPHIGHO2_12_FULL_63_18]HCX83140.1 flagellar biosynthesis anti-sigma factor FlgM [Rhodoferax sp.]
MKIGQPTEIPASVSPTVSGAAQKAAQNANASTAATSKATQSTRAAGVAVTVSTLARSLEKTERSDSADIDTQKVASVKASIQDGTYVVNAEAIADKLLSNAQEMLNRSAR